MDIHCLIHYCCWVEFPFHVKFLSSGSEDRLRLVTFPSLRYLPSGVDLKLIRFDKIKSLSRKSVFNTCGLWCKQQGFKGEHGVSKLIFDMISRFWFRFFYFDFSTISFLLATTASLTGIGTSTLSSMKAEKKFHQTQTDLEEIAAAQSLAKKGKSRTSKTWILLLPML